MQTTLSAGQLESITGRIRSSLADLARQYPGDPVGRQPVHTVYGGAQLFRSDTAVKLGRLAARSFAEYAPDANTLAEILGLHAGVSDTIYERVAEKLEREAVEDLRIDFEDGYGTRSDAEEDGHAVAAANELAAGMAAGSLPPFVGIRTKSFSDEAHRRSIRTVDLFLTTLGAATGGELPENFVVTLPKVVTAEQIAALADVFDKLEPKLGFAAGSLKFEIMVETAQSIVGADGRIALPDLIGASRGRCTAAHFGAYDFTASLGITSVDQGLLHQSCDFARNIMQVSLAGTGIRLSDSVTGIMPIGPHRGDSLSDEQRAENRSVVHRAWRLHYDNCRHSLANGLYQGWDLHPAQIPIRYAAVYAFFLEGLDEASDRLRNFVEKAAQATLVGDVFDDAATGQGLLNYFQRAVNCGAMSEADAVSRTGLTLEALHSGSFAAILEHRKLG